MGKAPPRVSETAKLRQHQQLKILLQLSRAFFLTLLSVLTFIHLAPDLGVTLSCRPSVAANHQTEFGFVARASTGTSGALEAESRAKSSRSGGQSRSEESVEVGSGKRPLVQTNTSVYARTAAEAFGVKGRVRPLPERTDDWKEISGHAEASGWRWRTNGTVSTDP